VRRVAHRGRRVGNGKWGAPSVGEPDCRCYAADYDCVRSAKAPTVLRFLRFWLASRLRGRSYVEARGLLRITGRREISSHFARALPSLLPADERTRLHQSRIQSSRMEYPRDVASLRLLRSTILRNDNRVTARRIIEPRFRAHGSRDNTLGAIRRRPVRPTGHGPVLCIRSFLRTASETTSPLVYSSPMYPVGEHTAARILPCFPPQSDSAARSFGRDYVGPSFPYLGNPARRHRVVVDFIPGMSVSPR